MNTPIHILVVDDHPIVREGLIAVLETQDDFTVVGEASNGVEALQKVQELTVDILLLDLAMPELDGVGVIEGLAKRKHPARVIVFTVFDTDERILSAIKAGAKGYLLKGAARAEIFQAVRTVHGGGSLLQPLVAEKLFKHMQGDPIALTPRELEVLKALAEGGSNKALAEALFISERTVKFHVSAILSKLGAANRTEAVQIAVRQGLIEL